MNYQCQAELQRDRDSGYLYEYQCRNIATNYTNEGLWVCDECREHRKYNGFYPLKEKRK